MVLPVLLIYVWHLLRGAVFNIFAIWGYVITLFLFPIRPFNATFKANRSIKGVAASGHVSSAQRFRAAVHFRQCGCCQPLAPVFRNGTQGFHICQFVFRRPPGAGIAYIITSLVFDSYSMRGIMWRCQNVICIFCVAIPGPLCFFMVEALLAAFRHLFGT